MKSKYLGNRRIVIVNIFNSILVYMATGELFNPTIRTRCINGFMSITVNSDLPYHGVAYAKGKRDSCYATGIGALETTINIPLTSLDRCGVVYDQVAEQYSLIVEVRQHHMIILQQDRVFNVSCPKQVDYKDSPANESSLIYMGVYDAKQSKVHSTVFGEEYQIRVWTENHFLDFSANEEFRVGSCIGFAGFNYSLDLTDHNGCAINPDILSNFEYDRSTGQTVASLYSMFKFPQHQSVHIQCAISRCQTACKMIDCERRRDSPDPADSLEDAGDSNENLMQGYFASTTVTVFDVGNRSEAMAMQGRNNCVHHYSLITSLCAVFGVLFIIAFTTNILFCYINRTCFCRFGGSKQTANQAFTSPLHYATTSEIKGAPTARPQNSVKHNGAQTTSTYSTSCGWYPGYYTAESPSPGTFRSSGSYTLRNGQMLPKHKVHPMSIRALPTVPESEYKQCE